jgi:hypothetical protein
MADLNCPFCAESIESDVDRCKHCGESLLKGSPCPLHPEQELIEACRGCGTYVCMRCKHVDTSTCDHCDQAPAVTNADEHYDFGVILGWVFKDPDWVSKVLLGTACLLGSIVVVPMFGLLGYWVRIVRQQRRNPTLERLPTFDDFGSLIREGLKFWVVMMLPAMIFLMSFFAVAAVAGGLLAASNGKGAMAAAGGIGMLVAYIALLVGALALAYVTPAIQMEYLDTGDLTSGLKLKRWWRRVADEPMEYFLLFVFHYVIRQILGTAGMILCFVGVYASIPWSMYAEAALMGRYLAKLDQRKKAAGAQA